MAAREKKWRIGIDFDNTIVGYDKVFLAAAKERQLLDQNFSGKKQAIRDAVRALPEGEFAWQRLQGHVYGRGMGDAVMKEGIDRFLRRCRAEGHTVLIVSHKTEYSQFDPDRVKLRDVALVWMAEQGLFGDEKYGISVDHVFFESTRDAKLRRIDHLACTHFIDDLQEVLTDPSFPPTVTRILLAEEAIESDLLPCIVCSTWRHIEEAVFSERA
jgi:hypothetical protein